MSWWKFDWDNRDHVGKILREDNYKNFQKTHGKSNKNISKEDKKDVE